MKNRRVITVQLDEKNIFRAFEDDSKYGNYPYLVNDLIDRFSTKKILKLIVNQCVAKLCEICMQDAQDYGLRALERTFGDTSSTQYSHAINYTAGCTKRAANSKDKAKAYGIVKEILADIEAGKAAEVVERCGK